MTLCLELSLPATPVSARTVRNEVAEVAARMGAPERVVEDARLCVNEAVTNVVRHAYRSSDGKVGVTVAREDDELTVVVRDEGVGLSDFVSEGDLGYGLRIIERLTSRHVISSAADRGTEVVMVFGLGSADRA
jgi:anti-sigma regulatory factor (Ser/Thr protein kinase)